MAKRRKRKRTSRGRGSYTFGISHKKEKPVRLGSRGFQDDAPVKVKAPKIQGIKLD